VTLCASLVDLVSSPDLAAVLEKELSGADLTLPSLRQRRQHSAEHTNRDSGPLDRDTYQSIFAEWSSPPVPAASVTSTEMILASSGDYDKLESTLLSALTAGFGESKCDGCYQLFLAWNSLNKLDPLMLRVWEAASTDDR